jgi:DNA polymerase-3 subunit gamma/tau
VRLSVTVAGIKGIVLACGDWGARESVRTRPGPEGSNRTTCICDALPVAVFNERSSVSYLVLARKYRPDGFASVSGQEHVTRTLANAIRRDRVVHAYLFTGPRGVGKTSVARILSKVINCQKEGATEPCLECSSCKEIGSGTSLSVREIDGASHNSVDNVRDLIDSFKSLPPPGYRFKVYIIDEVHMLSVSAFNALLKSLEEPPPNTVFILATTEVHKIPETVISRCQRHDFRALSASTIEARLREVCHKEGIEADNESLKVVARLADGSMRDAQTLLDRVISFCAGPIRAEETSIALGTVERRALSDLAQVIVQRDVEGVLRITGELFSTGIDPTTLLKEFVNFWREVFVAKLGGEARLSAIGVGGDTVVELTRLVSSLEPIDVQDLWDFAREGADRCLRSAYPRHGFEALVVRMATRQPVTEIGEVLGKLISGGAKEPVRPRAAGAPATAAARVSSAVVGTVAPEPQRPAAPSPANATAAPVGAGNWEELLRYLADSSAKVLLENLKRLKVTRFEMGFIEATGPEFTVNSLLREKDRLSELCNSFAQQRGTQVARGWRFNFSKGAGAFDPEVEAAQARSAESSLQTHPALQSLQKVFPGSKVEQVRVKNS